MKNLVIFGAAYLDLIKLVDAINRAAPTWKILGFIDDTPELKNKKLWGYPVFGGRELIESLAKDENTYFFNNVPTWPKCQSVSELLSRHSCKIPNLIHPSIDMNYVEIGKGCILPEGCVVGGNSKIGDFVTVRLKSLISHDVTVENYVFIGPGVTTGGHSVLKRGCFIGAGATVMGKKTVGEGALIGAGAVVVRDIDPHVTAVGVPAKAIKKHGQDK